MKDALIELLKEGFFHVGYILVGWFVLSVLITVLGIVTNAVGLDSNAILVCILQGIFIAFCVVLCLHVGKTVCIAVRDKVRDLELFS